MEERWHFLALWVVYGVWVCLYTGINVHLVFVRCLTIKKIVTLTAPSSKTEIASITIS